MKELKKLSLKKEVDREAEQIEQEVMDRKELDGIQVSDDMETSLFNKIQDYEYSKRTKMVYRKKKKKRYIVAALAAVLVLVLGSTMTSVGSKSYWKVLWDRIAGDEEASIINVEKMESQETSDIDEIRVYKEVSNELGISTVRPVYMPEPMFLKEYDLDKQQEEAILFYEYDGQIIRYMMYMNNTDSSHGQIETDQLVDQYQLKAINGTIITVKDYKVKDSQKHRYVAEFEYKDAQYQFMGIMAKEEFEKIIENLIFL